MPNDTDNGSTPDIHGVTVERAASKDISHTQSELLHESNRTRVHAIAWLVDRSSGDREASIKIETHEKKGGAAGLAAWLLAEKKSVTLKAAALQRLVEFARRVGAVAGEKTDGNFIVIRTSDAAADVANLDPEVVSRAIAAILQKKEIVGHLAGQELGTELVQALRGAIRLRELRDALGTLRRMLESGVVAEKEYQDWCAKHSWAFGSAYLLADDVRQIAIGDTVDLLLPSSLTGLRDVIELKRPDMPVVKWDEGHRNWFWTKEASQAIGQCHRYLDSLNEAAGNGLRDHPEIVAYLPRATVVIGRSAGWEPQQHRGLHGLNSRLNGIQIITYDQLLAQGERLIEAVTAPPPVGSVGQNEDFDDDGD